MLFSWDIARLRTEIQRNGPIDHFGPHFVRHVPVQLASTQPFGQEIRPASSAIFRPPACVFGRPENIGCLHDVVPGRRAVPAHAIYTLDNARIIGTVAALSEEKYLFCDGLARSPDDLERLYGFNQSNAHGFVLDRAGSEFTAHFLSGPEDRVVRGRTIFITSQEIRNFGCFLYWALPQFILLSESFHEPIDRYVVTDRSPWIFEVLHILGLPRRPIYTVEEVCGTRFEKLTMTNVLSTEGFFHTETREAFFRISRKLRIVDGGRPREHRKIFVSRALSHARAPHYRVLINESQLLEIAARHGFEIIFPETLTFADQIRVFDSAAVVVGPSGSGMLSTIFSPPGTAVVDMESFTVAVRQHARIYSSTEKLYSFCFGRFDARDVRPEQPMRHWHVDERDFTAALTWAEESRLAI